MERVDITVVGAGVVGLAAAELLSRTGSTVVVLEKHARHGAETSSRNSEVLHSGIHYPPGSLKAALCVEGRQALYRLCTERGIFCRQTGKLVVACEAAETQELEKLLEQGTANGVQGLELIDAKFLSDLEPCVRGKAALKVPCAGIIDSEGLMRYFLRKAEEQGAIFLWNAELSAAEPCSGGYRLKVKGMADPFETRVVVNAAGLGAEAVAALPGVDTKAAGYGLRLFKGQYFRLRKSVDVRRLIYPVPDQHGLGIHLTLDKAGGIRLGPDSSEVKSVDYEVDASRREAFLRAVSRYLPGLSAEDLDPDTAGVRPKLSADGSFKDFVIAEETPRGLPDWVNLVGIESPGLTASPAIARKVADLLHLSLP
ncbi:MAG: NAD(P)/FAD-dependent oxidoreductase [Elusimicrobia bacterium]|nr:NAD(P)/FAD-dependent oxidoreductase [Elusimicrobiota bacterium]